MCIVLKHARHVNNDKRVNLMILEVKYHGHGQMLGVWEGRGVALLCTAFFMLSFKNFEILPKYLTKRYRQLGLQKYNCVLISINF